MMSTLTTGRKPKRPPQPHLSGDAQARQRAVLAVMLGAPPAAVAADLGCGVGTLMSWVRARRHALLKAARDAAPSSTPDEAPPAGPMMHLPKQHLPADRQVAPENSAVVDAAYQAAEFDYSGRRIRPRVTH